MRPKVSDTLGFAQQSCRTVKTFVKVVKKHCHILAKQERKEFHSIRQELREACLRSGKVRRALASRPDKKRLQPTNFFPVVDKPDDYSLPREREVELFNNRVAQIRSYGLKKASPPKQKIKRVDGEFNYSLLSENKSCPPERICKLLADEFNERRWDTLSPADETAGLAASFDGWVGYDKPVMTDLLDIIKTSKQKIRWEIPRAKESLLHSEILTNQSFVSFDEEVSLGRLRAHEGTRLGELLKEVFN